MIKFSDLPKDLSGRSLKTLLIINKMKENKNMSMVTISAIVKESNGTISRPTVRKALEELENLGVINVIGKQGHTLLVECSEI
jgi:Fe2+ or Zn2+ uptake regulation protein